MANPAWEEVARIYLRFEGKVYRIKIFPRYVGVEAQPNGINKLYEAASDPIADVVYDPNTAVWDYAALARLITYYKEEN